MEKEKVAVMVCLKNGLVKDILAFRDPEKGMELYRRRMEAEYYNADESEEPWKRQPPDAALHLFKVELL
jgi:hypothetical protein